jgi:hypothetical protein
MAVIADAVRNSSSDIEIGDDCDENRDICFPFPFSYEGNEEANLKHKLKWIGEERRLNLKVLE